MLSSSRWLSRIFKIFTLRSQEYKFTFLTAVLVRYCCPLPASAPAASADRTAQPPQILQSTGQHLVPQGHAADVSTLASFYSTRTSCLDGEDPASDTNGYRSSNRSDFWATRTWLQARNTLLRLFRCIVTPVYHLLSSFSSQEFRIAY